MKKYTLILPLLTVFLGLSALKASDEERRVTVRLSGIDGATGEAVSEKLLGSHFPYHDKPIIASRDNEKLLAEWENAPVTMLRYPGGTWGDHFIWDDPGASYYGPGNRKQKRIMSQEQFIEICRKIGAEPILQINVASKGGSFENRINPTKIEDIREGAAWAARWVHEANIVNGWDVKYWEIGNEVWIWLKPEEYARHVAEYAKAMKAVDPDIKIIACGLSYNRGPFQAPWLEFPDDPDWEPRLNVYNEVEPWNEALLALEEGTFDYLAPHIYVEGQPVKAILDGEAISAEELYLQTTAKLWENEKLGKQIAYAEANPPVRLAITEWGTNFKHSVPFNRGYEEGLYFYSFANGINTALMFGQIVRGSPYADIAILHALTNTQTVWFWPEKVLLDEPVNHATFLAMKLWGQNLGNRLLETTVSEELPMTINGVDYPGVFAQGTEDDDYIYVVCINLNLSEPIEVKYEVDGGIDGAIASMQLSQSDLSATNMLNWNESRELAPIQIEKAKFVPGDDSWTATLPPHSMVGFKIEKACQ